MAWPMHRAVAAQLTDTGVVPAISAATVRRILREDAIKPLAVPVLDLSARPRLRRPGGPGTRALPAQLAGPGARRRRVRHQCRREDLHPGLSGVDRGASVTDVMGGSWGRRVPCGRSI